MPSIVGAKGVRIRYAKAKGRRGPRDEKGNAYHQRKQRLWRMGFIDYRAYLKSELWKSIRERLLSERPDCEVCGHPTACGHHLSYSLRTLGGDSLTQLASLCESCHKRIEFREDGRKRSFSQAHATAKKLLKRSGAWEKYHQTE